ncbi:MAG TPA: type III-B CRISPR module RAMP protein Cmr6 [Candidatus Aminicenantes bacterium]|nr:type III-B CRISPR module RAMP protein Cmr6 [Candidatus Aminicenantes bacterium]
MASLEAGLKKTFEDRFRSVELALVSPLVHGVGNDTPLEVGLTLHDVYGVPYLPGSTLKGIARAWATALLADKGAAESGGDFYKLWKEFDKALDRGECPAVKGADPDLFGRASRVFGCLTRAGAVSFLDAFPQGDFRFKADIMNPHFPEYYSEGRRKPPVENQNPIPVYFLVVTGGRFHFHLLAVDPKDSVLLKSASEWLIGGLTNLGAGGKTSAGYGRFAAD